MKKKAIIIYIVEALIAVGVVLAVLDATGVINLTV